MSRDCDDALANLYLYLDSELTAATTEVIQSHLAECGGCAGYFDFERRLKAVVRQRLDEEVPDEVMARLKVALSAEHTGG